MLQLTYFKKILATSLLLVSAGAFANDVGEITEHKGSGGLERKQDSMPTALGLGIQPLDYLETVRGRLKIEFTEGSEFSMTEGTQAVITKYYYDKKSGKGELAMNFVAGTARFTTGRLGLIPKENIVFETPTATIAVRGTDFTTTVDELGRSLVILLPETECTFDGDCSPSGSITVTNAGGTVTLDEAYAATMASTMESSPTQPVILDMISPDLINNMFIVNPPKKIVTAVEEESSGADSTDNGILDFTELDTDFLAEDFLEEEDDFSELDIDLLDVDFLQDVLVAIEEVDILKRGTKSAQGSDKFTGTKLGFDKETQYNSIIDTGMGQIWFYREVNAVISVRVPIDSNTTIESENEGKRNVITVGDGQSVIIFIRQSG